MKKSSKGTVIILFFSFIIKLIDLSLAKFLIVESLWKIVYETLFTVINLWLFTGLREFFTYSFLKIFLFLHVILNLLLYIVNLILQRDVFIQNLFLYFTFCNWFRLILLMFIKLWFDHVVFYPLHESFIINQNLVLHTCKSFHQRHQIFIV